MNHRPPVFPSLSRRTLLLSLATGIVAGPSRAMAQQPARHPAVASFTILADLVRQVGGDRLDVTQIVGPGGDVHVYDPTPDDARKLAAARIIFVNGLGFEGWLERLARAAGTKVPTVVATKGIKPRMMEEEEGGKKKRIDDPHAWQSIANAKVYVSNIRDGLVGFDPAGADAYRANAAAYTRQLDGLEAEVRKAIAAIPPGRRKIITTHDAFGYFGAAYGMAFIAPVGVSTETEASAQDVARIIRQIRAEKIPAVFLENVTDPRLADQIAKESGAKIGGTLYSDSLSAPDGPAGTYIDMFRHNIRELTAALVS